MPSRRILLQSIYSALILNALFSSSSSALELSKTKYKFMNHPLFCGNDSHFIKTRKKFINLSSFQKQYLKSIRNEKSAKAKRRTLRSLKKKLELHCKALKSLPTPLPTPKEITPPNHTPIGEPTPQHIITPVATLTATPTSTPSEDTCKKVKEDVINSGKTSPLIIECFSPSIPSVVLVHQQSYPLELNQSVGLRIDGISLSSKRFAAANTQSLEEVLEASADDIRSTLKLAQDEIANFQLNTSNLVIIDIENALHPRIWHTFDNLTLTKVLKAYKLRLEIAREQMPNAFLVAYGFPTPNGKGTDTLNQINNFIEASKLGVFDDVDGIMPALHFRFGPGEIGYESILNVQEEAVLAAMQIKKSNQTPIAVIPLLSFRVNNGQSSYNNGLVQPIDTAMQISMLQKYSERIPIIILWSANSEDLDVIKHLKEAFAYSPLL